MEKPEKLIRDNVHNISHPSYPNMQIRRVVDVVEHIGFLIAKIIEETREFEAATTNEERITEAGDILEVYFTLIELFGENRDFGNTYQCLRMCVDFLLECSGEKYKLDIPTIFRAQAQKRAERGGFKK